VGALIDYLTGIVLLGFGLLSVVGGATGWEWFMTHSKVAPVVARLGRTGARVLYVLVGIVVMAAGAWFFT
jgi:hypothetical protein